jgi:hypothetical protein
VVQLIETTLTPGVFAAWPAVLSGSFRSLDPTRNVDITFSSSRWAAKLAGEVASLARVPRARH